MRLYETITRLDQGAESLRRGHYGVIEAQDGRLERIVLRPTRSSLPFPGNYLGVGAMAISMVIGACCTTTSRGDFPTSWS